MNITVAEEVLTGIVSVASLRGIQIEMVGWGTWSA